MEKALKQAAQALVAGEFPVGCVLVQNNRVLADGARRGTAAGRINETDHAEIAALKRLEDLESTLDKPLERTSITCYCTLEPCLMCFGALLINGIRNIVFAYEDVMGGGTETPINVLKPLYREKPVNITGGILRTQSLALFREFFQNPKNTYLAGTLLARHALEGGQ